MLAWFRGFFCFELVTREGEMKQREKTLVYLFFIKKTSGELQKRFVWVKSMFDMNDEA